MGPQLRGRDTQLDGDGRFDTARASIALAHRCHRGPRDREFTRYIRQGATAQAQPHFDPLVLLQRKGHVVACA